jgi:transcription antitermination protein NusB
MRRSEQRQAAVVAIYQHDVSARPLTETVGVDASPFAATLAQEAIEHQRELDEIIARHSHGWSVERIHPLERAIMRVALIEMLYPELVPAEAPIPAEGAIEEAVRSAKIFCGSEAPAFINGVLGAVLREVRENAAQR